MSNKLLLSAKNLQKQFGAVVAAQDIYVDIRSGERVSLIGSNGAGKTTFVNMITGYLKPDSGQIEFVNNNITDLSPRQITHLGVARSFQIPQLYPALTVMENMLVAMACHENKLSMWRPSSNKENLARGADLLNRFGLSQHSQRRVKELPGGIRKLLDIALAMTGSPKLLLLDEPTSGVSAEEKFPMMDTIMRVLGNEPLTALFVEHDMDIVRGYADRVIAFYSGRVIADAAPEQALENDDVRRYVTGDLKQEPSHA
jgi:branched-chain amino acid transport system ATP-binding protein